MKLTPFLPALRVLTTLVLTTSLAVGCKDSDKADSKDSKEPATKKTPKADPTTKPVENSSKPDPAAEPTPAKKLVAEKKDTQFKTDVEILVPAGFEGFVTPHEGGEADPAAIDVESPKLKVHVEAAEKDLDLAGYIKDQLDGPPESQKDNGKSGWEIQFRDRIDNEVHYLIFNRELMLYCDGSPADEASKAQTREICSSLTAK